MQYLVITNNDGELSKRVVNSEKSPYDVCKTEYRFLVESYRDSDVTDWGFELTDEWEDKKEDEVSMGSSIDFCMGKDYIYDISVKVTAA